MNLKHKTIRKSHPLLWGMSFAVILCTCPTSTFGQNPDNFTNGVKTSGAVVSSVKLLTTSPKMTPGNHVEAAATITMFVIDIINTSKRKKAEAARAAQARINEKLRKEAQIRAEKLAFKKLDEAIESTRKANEKLQLARNELVKRNREWNAIAPPSPPPTVAEHAFSEALKLVNQKSKTLLELKLKSQSGQSIDIASAQAELKHARNNLEIAAQRVRAEKGISDETFQADRQLQEAKTKVGIIKNTLAIMKKSNQPAEKIDEKRGELVIAEHDLDLLRATAQKGQSSAPQNPALDKARNNLRTATNQLLLAAMKVSRESTILDKANRKIELFFPQKKLDYSISFKSANKKNNCIGSKIFITIVGKNRTTNEIELINDKRNILPFVNVATIITMDDIGDIEKIFIRSVCNQGSSDFFLKFINISIRTSSRERNKTRFKVSKNFRSDYNNWLQNNKKTSIAVIKTK